MRLKTSLACLAFLFFASFSGSAGEKANLSGTWKFDQDKSHSNGPGFNQTMTITHYYIDDSRGSFEIKRVYNKSLGN